MARDRARLGERGMSMIELLIAMTVLAIGMLGGVVMILAGVQSNSRNKNDTTAVVLDQEILEMFATFKNYPTTGFVAINDCAIGAASIHNASVVQAAGPLGAGATLYTAATAPSPGNVGDIDWTQPSPALATNAVTGYAMQYQACNGDIFEVRWNVMEVSPNPSSRISMLTVSSRQTSAGATHNATLFAIPTTLRTLIEN
jgi:prepilin-type N-terminal cleavage/methylation domain-containing protein